jgi:hypothetical protein
MLETLDWPKQLFRYKHAILFGYNICWMLKREFKSVYTFVISSLVYAFTRKHKTRLKTLKLSLTVTIILSKLLFQSKFKNLQSILPRLNNCRYFIQTVIWEITASLFREEWQGSENCSTLHSSIFEIKWRERFRWLWPNKCFQFAKLQIFWKNLKKYFFKLQIFWEKFKENRAIVGDVHKSMLQNFILLRPNKLERLSPARLIFVGKAR